MTKSRGPQAREQKRSSRIIVLTLIVVITLGMPFFWRHVLFSLQMGISELNKQSVAECPLCFFYVLAKAILGSASILVVCGLILISACVCLLAVFKYRQTRESLLFMLGTGLYLYALEPAMPFLQKAKREISDITASMDPSIQAIDAEALQCQAETSEHSGKWLSKQRPFISEVVTFYRADPFLKTKIASAGLKPFSYNFPFPVEDFLRQCESQAACSGLRAGGAPYGGDLVAPTGERIELSLGLDLRGNVLLQVHVVPMRLGEGTMPPCQYLKVWINLDSQSGAALCPSKEKLGERSLCVTE